MLSDSPDVSLVCCDLATIVIDGSIMERAFAEAIAAQGIVAGTQSYTRAMVKLDRARGRPVADVLAEFFGDEAQGAVASMTFDRSFRDAADRFGVAAPPVVVEAIGKITGTGARVCLLTALSRAACGPLAGRLLREGLGDLALCADDVPRGFPWPDLVLTAMLRLGVGDVREVAVVASTESALEAGRRAGAGLVIGLADGARQAAALHNAGAMHVVDSIDGVPNLVARVVA